MEVNYKEYLVLSKAVLEEAKRDAREVLEAYEKVCSSMDICNPFFPRADMYGLVKFIFKDYSIFEYEKLYGKELSGINFKTEIPTVIFKNLLADGQKKIIIEKEDYYSPSPLNKVLIAKELALVYWKEKKKREFDGESELIYMNLFAWSLIFNPDLQKRVIISCEREYYVKNNKLNQDDILLRMANSAGVNVYEAIEAYSHGVIKFKF